MAERLFDVEPIPGLGDEWYTPAGLRAFFAEWFDPCPPGGAFGLDVEWQDPTFVNPPYSELERWVSKAIGEARGGVRVAMLLRHDSSTQWWRMLAEYGAYFLPLMGRLYYGDMGKRETFPSVIALVPPMKRELREP